MARPFHHPTLGVIDMDDERPGAEPFLRDLAGLDARARAALREDLLTPSSSTDLYVRHHLDQLSAEEIRSLFSVTEPREVDDARFLAGVRLRAVWFRDDASRFATLDYSLGEEVTNYVLAVSFDLEGSVVAVEMES